MHLALCLLIVAFVHCLFIHWSFIVPLSFIVPSSLIHCSSFIRFCGHAIVRCLCCCGCWAVVTISSTIFWLLCRCCCLRCPLPLSSSSSLLSLIILVPIPCPHPASLSCVLIFFIVVSSLIDPCPHPPQYPLSSLIVLSVVLVLVIIPCCLLLSSLGPPLLPLLRHPWTLCVDLCVFCHTQTPWGQNLYQFHWCYSITHHVHYAVESRKNTDSLVKGIDCWTKGEVRGGAG